MNQGMMNGPAGVMEGGLKQSRHAGTGQMPSAIDASGNEFENPSEGAPLNAEQANLINSNPKQVEMQ